MKRTISLLLLLCFLLSFIVLLSGCGSSDRKIDAWVCAQDVVKGKLKSPSTAKFCSYSPDRVADLGNNKYKITGYVDAQNSFGAMIRKNFTVTLTFTESGYKNASCTIN